MAIAGIGTDIVELSRIEQALARGDRLARRILTPAELERFAAHTQPARYLAKRFAAKEAAVKALGTGIGVGISWQHIRVDNHPGGAPFLVFSDFSPISITTSKGVESRWSHRWLIYFDQFSRILQRLNSCW